MGRLARFIRFYTDEDDGNGGEKGVLKTVTGALLHIVDALAKPINKFTATLEPIQDLHGQDAPYPDGGGKNKFDVDKLVNTADITVSNGVISVTGVAKNSTKKLSELADLEVGETYTLTATSTGTNKIIYLYGTGANVAWNFSDSKQITQDLLDALVMFYGDSGATAQISNIMIRLSSVTDATFAPYSNICPITGHTGANVVRTGKNLLPDDFNAYRSDNNSYLYLNDIIPAGETARFTLTDKDTSVNISGCYMGFQNGVGVLAKGADIYRWIIENGVTAERVDNTGWNHSVLEPLYGVFIYPKTQETFNKLFSRYNIMVELGSTATDYEAPNITTIPITFPDAAGTVYGAKLINEGTETWKLRVVDVAVELRGSMFSGYSAGIGAIYGNQSSFLYDWARRLGGCAVCCSDATATTRHDVGLYSNGFFVGDTEGGNDGNLFLKLTGITTSLSTGKAYLEERYSGGNPVTLVYELATPIDYTLSESQALTLLKGENVVWCDNSDDLELQYYAKAEETP